jgi:hypothetical protein
MQRVKDVVAGMRGIFRIRFYKDRKLVQTEGERNMIVDGARLQMAHLVAAPAAARRIKFIAFGTSGDPATAEDTEIAEPVVKEIAGFEYPQDGQVQFNWTLGTDEANEKAIMEFGLLCEDGTLFARYVRQTPLNKDSSFSLEGDWTIVF